VLDWLWKEWSSVPMYILQNEKLERRFGISFYQLVIHFAMLLSYIDAASFHGVSENWGSMSCSLFSMILLVEMIFELFGNTLSYETSW